MKTFNTRFRGVNYYFQFKDPSVFDYLEVQHMLLGAAPELLEKAMSVMSGEVKEKLKEFFTGKGNDPDKLLGNQEFITIMLSLLKAAASVRFDILKDVSEKLLSEVAIVTKGNGEEKTYQANEKGECSFFTEGVFNFYLTIYAVVSSTYKSAISEYFKKKDLPDLKSVKS